MSINGHMLWRRDMKNQNRTYMLEMETPLGKRRGVLNLILLGDSVSGDLTLRWKSVVRERV